MKTPPEYLAYRLMRHGEEAEVCDLVMRVFDEFIAPYFSQEEVQRFSNYADPRLFQRRSQWNHFILVAVAQKGIAGMIEVRKERHITMFFVEKEFQGAGVGEELLRRALAICLRRNPKLSEVTVNSSPNAVKIYERLGFQHMEKMAKCGAKSAPMILDLSNHLFKTPPYDEDAA